MMDKISRLLLYLTISLLLFSCSASKKRNSDVNLSEIKYTVSDSGSYAWINLMPGGKPRFHVSGDIEIMGTGNFEQDSLKLDEIKVFQKEKFLYSFHPLMNNTELYIQQPGSPGKKNHFSDGKGFEPDTSFTADLPVVLEYIFVSRGNSFQKRSKEIKVEKVY